MSKKAIIVLVALAGIGLCLGVSAFLNHQNQENPRLVIQKAITAGTEENVQITLMDPVEIKFNKDGVLEQLPSDFEVFSVIERNEDKAVIQYRRSGDGTFLSTIPLSTSEMMQYITLKTGLEDEVSYQVAYRVD